MLKKLTARAIIFLKFHQLHVILKRATHIQHSHVNRKKDSFPPRGIPEVVNSGAL